MSKVKTTTKKVAETAKKGAQQAANHVKSNPLTIAYVVGGALVVYLGYKLVKGISNISDGLSDDPYGGGGNVGTLPNPSQTPAGATITATAAQILAADILSAVDSLGGVNETEYQTIENALKGKNAYDFQLISEAFGTPSRSPFTGEESTWWLGGEQLNLTQWLTVELDTAQKQRLHNAAPLIWPAP